MKMHENLPQPFLDRLIKIIPPQSLQLVLSSLETKPCPSFRTNTLKITTTELTSRLVKQGFHFEKVIWYPDAFLLLNKSVRELTETDEYQQGFLYIQSLSSMIPSLVLAPKPDEKILDLCAAPGSKTTQLAMLMHNQGEILANDLSRQRIFKLKANLTMNGVTNTNVTNTVGEKIWQRYPEYFDKTLVDVPCSMEGRIRLDEPTSYQDWSLKKIKLLANKQKYLLLSAISATKVGGTIVYSTCTLAPEENEGVIDWILKKIPQAVTLEQITLTDIPLQPGLTQWTKHFSPQMSLTTRILPSNTMEGFFIAKIRKVQSTT